MKLETLRVRLNKAIEIWLTTKNNEEIKKLIKPMEKRWLLWAKEENDYREGEDTYGYSDSESVENHMLYISDRWRCAFRLKWIIDGVNSGHI